jgi:hypothetical protein
VIEEQVSSGRLGALALHGAAALTGGIPLTAGDEVIGAIGTSGGAGGGGGRLRAGADRPGQQAAHPAAFAAVVRLQYGVAGLGRPARGIFQGRFLMTPAPGARPALERRLLAVAFADQVGAALVSSHPVGQS